MGHKFRGSRVSFGSSPSARCSPRLQIPRHKGTHHPHNDRSRTQPVIIQYIIHKNHEIRYHQMKWALIISGIMAGIGACVPMSPVKVGLRQFPKIMKDVHI